jgi:hypothetical protein
MVMPSKCHYFLLINIQVFTYFSFYTHMINISDPKVDHVYNIQDKNACSNNVCKATISLWMLTCINAYASHSYSTNITSQYHSQCTPLQFPVMDWSVPSCMNHTRTTNLVCRDLLWLWTLWCWSVENNQNIQDRAAIFSKGPDRLRAVLSNEYFFLNIRPLARLYI